MERGKKRKSCGRGKLRGGEQILSYPSFVKVEGKDGFSPSHFPATSPCPFSFTSPSPSSFLPTSTPPSPPASLMWWRTWLMPHLNWCWPPPIPPFPLSVYNVSTSFQHGSSVLPWLSAYALAPIPALVPAPPFAYNSSSRWLWPRGIERERDREKELERVNGVDGVGSLDGEGGGEELEERESK